jgi:hypothetical protein
MRIKQHKTPQEYILEYITSLDNRLLNSLNSAISMIDAQLQAAANGA